MRTSTTILAGLLVGAILGGAHQAAADMKTLPGSACTWMWESYLGSPLDRPEYAESGYVLNPSASNEFQAFSCPIVRDDLGGGGDGDIEAVEVYVRDQSTSHQIQCRVTARDATSATGTWGAAVGSSDGYGTLTPVAPADYSNGLYNIYCTVPGSTSQIRGYMWDE